MELLKYLQVHALFGGVGDASMARIVPMLGKESYKAGDFIVREDDDGDRMYFICEGSVEVLKSVKAQAGADSVRLAVLGAGDTFGEMHLVDIERRSASVRALEPVMAMTLSSGDLYRLHKVDPDAFTMVMMNMAREISRRLRRMDEIFGTCAWTLGRGWEQKHIGPVGRESSTQSRLP